MATVPSERPPAPDPVPNPRAALEFLHQYHPGGPWVLTAITLDQKQLVTETFRLETSGALQKWVSYQNEAQRRNVYFHVNPMLTELKKRAARTDVAEMSYLHVDIDPRAGEDLAAEQERILNLLHEPPPSIPPPTVILFSGGGVQGFWKLREPFKIRGQLNLAEEAARYNLTLVLAFEGSDNCQSVDHLMRLPGTVNWPGPKKRKKGRVPALARVVAFHEDRVYDLGAFKPAPAVQEDVPLPTADDESLLPHGNVSRLAGIEDLPEDVPSWCKKVIAQGHDPDEPAKYGSRSEAVFAVACELVRCGVSNEVIFSILTDSEFGISGHVLDQPRPRQYALRQIRRAREHAVHPKLVELNDKHAVIGDVGGRCRVLSEIHDPALDRTRLSFQSFSDFENRYLNERVKVGTDANGKDVFKTLGWWWLRHGARRTYETVTFAPGRDVPRVYNLWRGFACEARPGDCSAYLAHVRDNICSGNEEHYEWVLSWMARAVQHPDSPGYSAIVLRGDQGVGKSFFAEMFGSLFGHHYLPVSDSTHLVGHFNAHLQDAVVVFGDEAFYAGDRKHASILKTLITSEILAVEAKYRDVAPSKNCVHLIMASDEGWVVPAGVEERRFFVLEVARSKQDQGAYFRAIRKQMDSGGREALLDLLLRRELDGFDARQPPRTEALRLQRLFSLRPEEEWWYTKLREGLLLPEQRKWIQTVLVEELTLDYVDYTRRFSATKQSNATRLAHFLRKALPSGFPKRRQTWEPAKLLDLSGRERTIQRPWVYDLPTLEACREHWDHRFGGPYEWPLVLEEPATQEAAF